MAVCFYVDPEMSLYGPHSSELFFSGYEPSPQVEAAPQSQLFLPLENEQTTVRSVVVKCETEPQEAVAVTATTTPAGATTATKQRKPRVYHGDPLLQRLTREERRRRYVELNLIFEHWLTYNAIWSMLN